MSTAVSAIQHIRRLRGGSQAHLLSGSDGGHYVTKFQNNPQHLKVLANEMFAGQLGKSLQLPVAEVEVIEVGAALVDRSPELYVDVGGRRLPCRSGRQVASRYVCDLGKSVSDFLPETFLTTVTNLEDFARVLVLDKWAANTDGRQAVFTVQRLRPMRYAATFVDHGYCFNGGEWTFRDSPPRLGTYSSKLVYQSVTGWHSFEPALSLAESMSADQIWRCAENIPPEWFEHQVDDLMQLAKELYRRRPHIRDLITEFRASARNPFPNWTD